MVVRCFKNIVRVPVAEIYTSFKLIVDPPKATIFSALWEVFYCILMPLDFIIRKLPASASAIAPVLILTVSIFGAFVLGSSWHWDRGHYHEYLGWAWIEERLGEGLLPAGNQGLLNPVAFAPRLFFAHLTGSQLWASLAIAAWQSLALLGIWLIALDRIAAPPLRWAALALAFLTPVFLAQLGDSSIDVTAGLPVLFGVWACLRGGDPQYLRATRCAYLLVGGFAMGVALGLKLSHAFPAVLAPLLFLGVLPRRSWAEQTQAWVIAPLSYGLGAIAGIGLSYGAWGWALYQRFGNPVFPFLSGLFHTDAAPANPAPQSAVDAAQPALSALSRFLGLSWWDALLPRLQAGGARFIPQSWSEFLSLPWNMADPRLPANMAYVEWHAPEPRLLIWVSLLCLVPLMWAARFWIRRTDHWTRQDATPWSAANLRLWLFMTSWLLVWIVTSTNGRYGVILLMLISVPIVQTLQALLPSGWPLAVGLLCVLALQGFYAIGIQQRLDQRNGGDWAHSAVEVSLPPALREQPTLHIVPSSFSWSFLLPHLHPRSTFLHLPSLCRGAGCPAEFGQKRADQLLQSYAGAVRVLAVADVSIDGHPDLSADNRAIIDQFVSDLDLRLGSGTCDAFKVFPMFGETWMTSYTDAGRVQAPSEHLVSCPLESVPGFGAQVAEARDRHAPVFQKLSSLCPRELGFPSGPTLWSGKDHWVQYFNTRDIRIQIEGQAVSATRMKRDTRKLGTIDEVLSEWNAGRCSELVWTDADRQRVPLEGVFQLLKRPITPSETRP